MGRSWMNRMAVIGCLASAVTVVSVTVGQSPAPVGVPPAEGLLPQSAAGNGSTGAGARTVTPMVAAEGMLGFAAADGSGGQTVTLVDVRRSWLVVYAVDAKGQVKLLSSRPISQDFAVQYNVTDPTPDTISRLNTR